MDWTYRTIPRREGRAIAGLSMGGYGSIMLGLRNPDLFISIGSTSGALEHARQAAARLRGTERAPAPEAVALIPMDVALQRTCLAIAVDKNLLTVAMHDPLLFTLVQDLEFQTGYRIKQVVATQGDIVDAIHAAYPAKALVRAPQGSTAVAAPAPAEPARHADAGAPRCRPAVRSS